MNESTILRKIILAISHGAARLFRNNSGALRNDRGEWVHYGLGVGTSDLIGWKTVTIEPCHVGLKMAVFCAIEVKSETGHATISQQDFILAVKRAGGIAGIARSTEEAINIIS